VKIHQRLNAPIAVLVLLSFLTAAHAGSEEVLKDSPSSSSTKSSQFFERIQDGDTEAVRSMIAAGTGPNVPNPDDATGATALQAALGNIEIMQALIAAGANLNAVNRDGNSALMLATDSNLTESAKVLVNAGADVNLRNHKRYTPLINAVTRGNQEVVKLLLAHKAEINAETAEGRTALMVAYENGSFEMVQLLMDASANEKIRSK
jgi:predicted LPLAT superfamily acyltransferase